MAEEQPPEVKAEARQFMSDLLGSGPPPSDFKGGDGIDMVSQDGVSSLPCRDTGVALIILLPQKAKVAGRKEQDMFKEDEY